MSDEAIGLLALMAVVILLSVVIAMGLHWAHERRRERKAARRNVIPLTPKRGPDRHAS